jgi:DUF4097 and DUF4098 domain-containing protein YvlB
MQNQQFEPQEWQPNPQQSNINTDPREQQAYNPLPGYIDPREKIQPVRRRRRPWLWIIGIVVIVALLGGGIQTGLRNIVNTSSETHTYTIATLPTLVINDDTGTVTIHTGGANSPVTIQATKHFQSFGSAPTVQYSQSGDTINASVQNLSSNFLSLGTNNVDFTVTVPANANLQIHTATGSIDVNGVSGNMSLSTATGSITANHDALSGQSTLQSNTGDITFDGSIASTGNYQFSSDTGSVDVTLPSNASFHVDATTDTGSIDSDFSQVQVKEHDVTGSDAHGDVGSSPGAAITLKTNTGDINLHMGQ